VSWRGPSTSSSVLAGLALLACAATASAGAAGCAPVPAPSPDQVQPGSGPGDRQVQVTIHGANFLPVVQADFNSGRDRIVTRFVARLGDVMLGEVTYVDSRTLSARVPAGMAPGRYDLTVIDPRGTRGQLSDAYLVEGETALDGGTDVLPGVDAGGGGDGADGPPMCPPEDDGEVCDASRGGLVACYRFEGNGRDDSSNGNDLALDNVSFDPGVEGQALHLSQDSSVHAGDSPSWQSIADALTLELFFNPDARPMAGGNRNVLLDRDQQYALFWLDSGAVVCRLGGTDLSSGGGALAVGQWTHVACTLEAGTLRLYVDGVQVQQGTASPVGRSTATFNVGENSPDGNDQARGLFDRVRVWSRALSPAEICRAAAH
jgi:hypothetical protein